MNHNRLIADQQLISQMTITQFHLSFVLSGNRERSVGIINNSRIVELRLKKKWEQKQLAQEAGVAQSVISRLEQGLQADFKISVIAAVAKALGVSVDSLVALPYQPETGEIVIELAEAVTELSNQPKAIQRQAAGILRGYLATVSSE